MPGRDGEQAAATAPRAEGTIVRFDLAGHAARMDAAMKPDGFDLVIAACGNYGIPLLDHCRYVATRRG